MPSQTWVYNDTGQGSNPGIIVWWLHITREQHDNKQWQYLHNTNIQDHEGSRNISTPLFTLIWHTSDKSLGWMVTHLACIAQRFMSSMSLTSQASMASWMANNAVAWKQRSILKSCATSLISLATHSFLHSNSVLFWYLLICWSATVPGQNLWGFLMAPVNASLLLLPGFFLGRFKG